MVELLLLIIIILLTLILVKVNEICEKLTKP